VRTAQAFFRRDIPMNALMFLMFLRSRWCRSFPGLLLTSALFLAGCGNPMGTVSGHVAYKGQPLPSGTVTFLTEKGKVFTSQLTSDGSYCVRLLPSGSVKITVQTPPQITFKDAAPRPADIPATPPPSPSVTIPPKYSDPNTSGLMLDVTGGMQTHDIAIQ
jgi:hypothetical protein